MVDVNNESDLLFDTSRLKSAWTALTERNNRHDVMKYLSKNFAVHHWRLNFFNDYVVYLFMLLAQVPRPVAKPHLPSSQRLLAGEYIAVFDPNIEALSEVKVTGNLKL